MAVCGFVALGLMDVYCLLAFIPALSQGIPPNNLLFFGIPSLSLAMYAILWYEKSVQKTDLHHEGIRYVEYSITASLLMVAFCTPVIRGFSTVDACIIYASVVFLNLVAAIGPLFSVGGATFSFRKSVYLWPYLASWVLFFVSWLRFSLSVLTPFTEKYAPPVAKAAIAILFSGYFSFGLMHFVYKWWDWNSGTYVMCLDVLSLLVKTILSCLALSTSLFANGRPC